MKRKSEALRKNCFSYSGSPSVQAVVQEGVFEDEVCNECIEKITYLEELIEIEKTKLFRAMRNAKDNVAPPLPHLF